jgi:ligand-binding sensor domain-containing protein
LIDDDIKSITIDSAWNIWAGTSRGVTMYDGVKWTNYTVDDGLPGNKVMLVAADPDGVVWVTTTAGVARFVKGKWVKEK